MHLNDFLDTQMQKLISILFFLISRKDRKWLGHLSIPEILSIQGQGVIQFHVYRLSFLGGLGKGKNC